MINEKDCLTGFHIPNAFTPDGNGKNDAFRPLISGNIRYYKFTIYDRWGGIAFQSETPGKGWDGRVNGIEKASDVFVWTCSYQLEGEEIKNEKGTVVLVR